MTAAPNWQLERAGEHEYEELQRAGVLGSIRVKYAGSYGSAPNNVSVCGPPLKKAISMALLSVFGTSPGASGEHEFYVFFETGGE